MDYQGLCLKAKEVVLLTGSFIQNEIKKITLEKIEVKGEHNFVTYVDKTAEKMLVEGLSGILPGSGFIVEEGTVGLTKSTFQWVVDPLDGTTNFIHGFPPYSISVALMEADKTIIGIVYEISRNECFYSWLGGQVYLNGNVVKVSSAQNLSASLLATGFPYYDYGQMSQFLGALEYFMKNSHGVRRPGSAAVDLAYVASGRCEGFWEYGLNPWDVSAGAFLVEQAGGKVSDFSGGNDYLFGREIIASNNLIFDQFQKVLFSFFKK